MVTDYDGERARRVRPTGVDVASASLGPCQCRSIRFFLPCVCVSLPLSLYICLSVSLSLSLSWFDYCSRDIRVRMCRVSACEKFFIAVFEARTLKISVCRAKISASNIFLSQCCVWPPNPCYILCFICVCWGLGPSKALDVYFKWPWQRKALCAEMGVKGFGCQTLFLDAVSRLYCVLLGPSKPCCVCVEGLCP